VRLIRLDPEDVLTDITVVPHEDTEGAEAQA
jgi:hypothetical protein